MKDKTSLLIVTLLLGPTLSWAQTKAPAASTPATAPTTTTTSPSSKAFEAARSGKIEVLEELSKKMDLGSAKDGFDNTLLMEAASNGREAIIKFLVGKKVNLDAKNQNDETALWMAMDNNQIPSFEALIAAGAKVDTRTKAEKDTLLIRAASQNNYLVINRILRVNKSLIDAQNDKGETALIVAAQFGNKDSIKSLLRGKANKSIKDKSGLTALDHATKNGLTETMKLLSGKK